MQILLDITGKALEAAYTVERLSADNLDDLEQLHEAIYALKPAPGYYSRKYDTSYTGISYTGFIAYNHHRLPVAYYGVIPCFIQSGREIILAAQSADTMTHPNHRFKGMFVELSKKTFELCRQSGIRFVFGFPNQHSYHGAVNKLGWQLIVQMVYFTIKVRCLPLENLSKKIPGLNKVYRRYRQAVLSAYETGQPYIASSVIADGFAGVYRSDEYIGYKTYSETRIIEINNVKFWISNKPGLLVGDIEGLDDVNFKETMAKLEGIARKLGIRQVQFHCSPDTSLCRLFQEHYAASPSYPVLFQDFGSTVSPMKARFCFADIDIF
jgi:hypothetical protein